MLLAYVDGINANIRTRGKNLPLEFGSAGLVPEPWTVEDVFSFVALNSWMFQENYTAELTALAGRRNVELQEWKDIFPDHPGATLPDDAYFESLRRLNVGAVNLAALSFLQAVPESVTSASGSNAWVVAHGPGIDIAGASRPGAPGILIGHTQSVAWGMTILPVDCLDLFVVRVDPKDPTRYYVGDQTLSMEREDMVFAVKGGKPRTLSAYRTIYGPVITSLKPGVDAAVALRWYGTLPPASSRMERCVPFWALWIAGRRQTS